jgi:hypothetical protein
MRKVLPIILSGALLTGFGVNSQKTEQDLNPQIIDVQAENTVKKNENNFENFDLTTLDKSDINAIAQTGVAYVKSNEYDDLSQEEKSYMYNACLEAMNKLGFKTDNFTYDDMNNLYNSCRDYMLENNVDPETFGLKDQAKLFNMCRNYLKNSNSDNKVGCMSRR